MIVSRFSLCRLYNLLIALGLAHGALGVKDFSSATSGSVHFPLLPDAAFSDGQGANVKHFRIRAMERGDSTAFFTAKESKGDKDAGEEAATETAEDAESGDNDIPEAKKKSPDKEDEEESEPATGEKTEEETEKASGKETGGDEDSEGASEQEPGSQEDIEGGEGESAKETSPENEDKEEKPTVNVEDVYISQQLPEPSVGVADAQEACDSMQCSKVVGGASPKSKITGCSRAVKCEQCRSKLAPEERCTNWKPPSRATIIMATGWSTSKVKLLPGSALNLPITWDRQDLFEDDKCLPDTKQVDYAYKKVNETGNVEKFPYTRVLSVQLAIHSTPIEGAKETKKTPQLVYSIELADPFSWNAVVPGGGAPVYSPRCHQQLQTLPGVQLRGQSAAFGVGWFSVLKDKTNTLSPTNVGVRVQCVGTKSCNLKKYAVCLRVTCPPTAASAEQQMAAGLDAMKKPVGKIPANVTEGGPPADQTEAADEDPYAVLPLNFNAWAQAQQPGWGGSWQCGKASASAMSTLVLAFVAVLSAAVNAA